MDGAVLAAETFLLRFFGTDNDDRLLLVNLGVDFEPPSVAEPLLAPSPRGSWNILWSSEDPQYGGSGTAPFLSKKGYFVAGRSALVVAPELQTASREQ